MHHLQKYAQSKLHYSLKVVREVQITKLTTVDLEVTTILNIYLVKDVNSETNHNKVCTFTGKLPNELRKLENINENII